MSDMPASWTSCPLAELLTSLESGSRPRGGVRGIASGRPSIGGEHLTYKGGFDFGSIRYVPEEFAERMKRGHIQPNDILIVKDGATTGKTAFVGSDFPFQDAVVNEHVFICRPISEVEPRFLFRYLTSQDGQERILENFQGSAQGGINLSFAPNTQVPLAPFNEQKRIAEKLESLLAKVGAAQERLDRIPAILKRFRQSVLTAGCTGKLTADRRIDSEVDPNTDLPFSWSKTELIELCDPARGVTYGVIKLGEHIDDGIPCLRTSDVKPLLIETGAVKRISSEISNNYRRTILRGDEVLVNVRGTLGGVAVVPESLKGWNVSREIAVVPIVKHVNSRFVAFWVASMPSQNWLNEKAKGVAYTGINLSDLRLLPIALPGIEEQKEIVRRVEELFKLADQIEERYNRSRRYTDTLTPSILAKAFRGELVPQDPDDEPASVLLERMKKRDQLEPRASIMRYPKRKQRRKSMTPREDKKNVIDALTARQAELSSKDLFFAMGHSESSSPEEVESFFIDLRAALDSNQIQRSRRGDSDWFCLVESASIDK